ncbi:MAG: hypothetical protein K2X47_03625 [Bdellovibrionales bacterium]|nr:hypothetical protein [Bdellovibrionales bacterium]
MRIKFILPLLGLTFVGLISCREVSEIDGRLSITDGQKIVVKDLSGKKHELTAGPMSVTVRDTGIILLRQGSKKVQLRIHNPRKLFRFNLDLKGKQIGQSFDLIGRQKTVVADQGNRWVKKPCAGCNIVVSGSSIKESQKNCEGATQWLEDYRLFRTEVELNFEQNGKPVGHYSGLSAPFEQTHRVAETLKSTCPQTAKKDETTIR